MQWKQINPNDLSPPDMHKLLIGSVVPRPIAWVSSMDRAGVHNLAPFSFFNVVCAKPPTISISITYNPQRDTGRKDTLRNIVELGEFVVNITTEATAVAMDQSAEEYPPHVDEFAEVGLTRAPSVRVRPARVAGSPISLECTLLQTVPVGTGAGSATLVLGTVQLVHVREDIIDDRYRIDTHALQPIGRLAGLSYCYVRELFDLKRTPYQP
jgi:flavin reductase (DIM6/NTAB) family NADH-FMN oxidoreductase RutF